MSTLRKLWRVVQTPKMVLVDNVVAWWLRRRGYEVVERWALTAAREALCGAGIYADRSGHLNTVKGRRPRAVGRLTKSMAAGYLLSAPTSARYGRKAVPARRDVMQLHPEIRPLLESADPDMVRDAEQELVDGLR